jgi:hypothetical protein
MTVELCQTRAGSQKCLTAEKYAPTGLLERSSQLGTVPSVTTCFHKGALVTVAESAEMSAKFEKLCLRLRALQTELSARFLV